MYLYIFSLWICKKPSREGMWTILTKKGVPDVLVSLIRDFYTGKEAFVFTEGVLSDPFELNTGLGQGCCLAPFLFNLFLSAVMENWEGRIKDKLHWPYRIDGLFKRSLGEGQLAKYASWETLQLHDLGYADDSAFITDTYQKLRALAPSLQSLYSDWGLSMSVEKSEILSTNEKGTQADISVHPCDGVDTLHVTDCFKYLGAHVTQQKGCRRDIAIRIDAARKAFWALHSCLWSDSQISLKVKLRVFRSCVLAVLLYGSCTWTTTYACRRQLNMFYMKCLRTISGFTLFKQEHWHLSDERLREWLGVPPIMHLVSQSRLRWLGHLARMDNSRLPKQMLFAFLPGDVGIPTQAGRKSGKG